MANIKSQKKRNLQNERRRVRNKSVRTSLKTAVKKVRTSAEGGDLDAARTQALEAARALDKAASHGVIVAHVINAPWLTALFSSQDRASAVLDMDQIQPLVAITHDLVSGIELRETRRRLRISLVGVGVQFFGETPICALDIGLARTL